MKKYEYENIFEYEKISSNLLFEKKIGFLVASNIFLENIYEYEKISSDFKIFMNSKSAAHFHMSKYNREMKTTI